MPEVEFSEEQFFNESVKKDLARNKKATGPSNIVIRMGLAKDETGANIVLIGVAVLAIALAIVVFLAAK